MDAIVALATSGITIAQLAAAVASVDVSTLRRRGRDGEGDVWTETVRGTGQYILESSYLRGDGLAERFTVEDITLAFDGFRELPPGRV